MCTGKAGAVFQTVLATVLYFKPNGKCSFSEDSETKKRPNILLEFSGHWSSIQAKPQG